uniref:Enhancer of polycomb-like protein n=1 Tax=Ascaris lumbricoides TaxID=6252 RepID=A0A0M3HY89_ASCLU
MATTSKLSFRARNLDASKSMPVYVVDELPDLAECAPINRAVAQMPTGMEKDEEMVFVICLLCLVTLMRWESAGSSGVVTRG